MDGFGPFKSVCIVTTPILTNKRFEHGFKKKGISRKSCVRLASLINSTKYIYKYLVKSGKH